MREKLAPRSRIRRPRPLQSWTAWVSLSRPYWPVPALGLAVIMLSSWARGCATEAWSSTRSGHPGYTPPHENQALPEGAEMVHLRTTDGVEVVATYLGKNRQGALVLLPGLASTRRGLAIQSVGLWLSQRFDVLIVDPRGNGQSGGTFDTRMSASLDVLAACAWLQGKNHATIGVVAEQETALAAVHAAVEQRSFQALALVAPTATSGETRIGPGPWLDGKNPWSQSLLAWGGGPRTSGHDTLNLVDEVRKLPALPTLWVGSKRVDGDFIRQAYMLAPDPRSLRLYPNAGSPVAWSDYPVHVQTLGQWFELCLPTPSVTDAASESPSIVPGSGNPAP